MVAEAVEEASEDDILRGMVISFCVISFLGVDWELFECRMLACVFGLPYSRTNLRF